MTAKSESKSEHKREIVTPGEIIAKGDVLPGDWTAKFDGDVISTRLGIVEKIDKLVKVVPISGVYFPRRNNVVIGRVEDITMRGWIVNIMAPYSAFLLLKECPMYINESEMEEVYNIGDLVVAKIFKTGRESADLTTKGRGLGKINSGLIVKINPHRVPRVIGKEGSMIKQIKIATDTEVTVGQNGIVWIKGSNLEDELLAKAAVEFVIANTTSEGLTEKVEEWLKKNKKPGKRMEDVLSAEKSADSGSDDFGESEGNSENEGVDSGEGDMEN